MDIRWFKAIERVNLKSNMHIQHDIHTHMTHALMDTAFLLIMVKSLKNFLLSK
jgi:hypothetical protein